MSRQAPVLEAFTPPRGQRLRAAVLSTFDLDIEYLEETLLPTIVGLEADAPDPESTPEARRASPFLLELRSRLREAKVAVLADKGRHDFGGEKSTEAYDLFFAKAPGAFHPKLHLLAFDRDFRLVVSSANLTASGFHRNLEVLWTASTERGDRFGTAARDAADFLSRLRSRHWPESRALSATIAELKHRLPRGRGEARVLHSEAGSTLLDQWGAMLPAELDELHVVTPFLDRGDRWRPLERFRGTELHLYLVEQRAGGKPYYRIQASPKALAKAAPTCLAIDPAWAAATTGDEETGPLPRTLHAKCYVARAGERGTVLLGSPNFTANAFLGRNVEAAVAIGGPWRNVRQWLPPTRPQPVDVRQLTFAEPPEDSESGLWTPFLVTAEYDASSRTVEFDFERRAPRGRWSVCYEGRQLAGGIRFPRTVRCPMKLGMSSFLNLEEGDEEAKFPFSVAEKDLLPTLPGGVELGYDDILEYLASGVSNLARFRDRVIANRGSQPRGAAAAEHVPEMERLRRLTRALEGLRGRLGRPIETAGEARALFHGDLGVWRILEGLQSDRALGPTFRAFALLELGAVVGSIRWKGEAAARARARREVSVVRLQVRRLTKGALPLSDLYHREGPIAWATR